MKFPSHSSEAGMGMPEVLVAVLLLGFFFPCIFEVNSICLRFIDAAKQSMAALDSVHDRCESLRNLNFTDLTNISPVRSLVTAPANGSDFCKIATEVVKISAYPTPNGVTQFTRKPDGTVTNDSVATDLGTQLVQVDVTTSWNMAFGGRPRSEEAITIISNGSKK
jgi:hypothetical protein